MANKPRYSANGIPVTQLKEVQGKWRYASSKARLK